MTEKTFCEECCCWDRLFGVLGECRRRAPIGLNEDQEGLWPLTADDGYCWDGIPNEGVAHEHA